jgi:hypothetical protein
MVDIHADRVHRPKPKGGIKKAFDFPLTKMLREIINEALAAKALVNPSSEYLFSAEGTHGHFVGICHNAPLGVSPHCIRRTFASACIA